ncbi:MAG: cyclic-di-AMP phosphodiesterase PgpH [Kosmotogales bacterium]|nr:cyclic-di-AMP phosphodiesterase PgpH [Kosmotogales bacterium]
MNLKERKEVINNNFKQYFLNLIGQMSVYKLIYYFLYPTGVAVVALLFYRKPISFYYILGSILFWYIFAETSFKFNRFFKLHKTYRFLAMVLVLIGVVANSSVSLTFSQETLLAATPIFLSVSLIAVLLGFEVGVGTGLFMSFLISYNIGESLGYFIVFSFVSIVSSYTAKKIIRRIDLSKAALIVSLLSTGIILIVDMIEGNFNSLELLIAVLNPLVCSVIVIGLLPYIESGSRIYSDVGLVELGNLSHPLLLELSKVAPGTYYHSVNLANLSESAAKSIGVNAIFSRVASYYHDIGKSKRPDYFTENQNSKNPHDDISPSMSNLVINDHVKYGMDLAKKFRLPILFSDIICQHHGTRVKKFFYHKARKINESEDSSNFKYPGPKPKFKESGIIMLADSVEAAFKSVKEPTPGKIMELVEEIVNDIYIERQLDESELNLMDLEKIITAFSQALMSISQTRIGYPEEKIEKVIRANDDKSEK